jgi:hypothetical protein
MSDALQRRIENGADIAFSEELLTRRQLAQRANVSVRTVDNWVRRRQVPVIAVGKRLKRFRWSDVWASLQRFERKALGDR